MVVADNTLTRDLLYAPPLRQQWRGNFKKTEGAIMGTDQTIDVLSNKLERVHVLADILLDLLINHPQAQVIAEIIMETSLLPGA